MPSSYHGLLVVDKPAGMTSRAVVDCVQQWFPPGTRIGHTGTLDPLATGVLVLCIGVATRLAEYVQDMEKVYRAGILLGSRSDSDDADGVVTAVAVEQAPTLSRIEQVLQGFVGEIDQVPPEYSAAHMGGRRAYELARKGRAVALLPRRVQIAAIEVLSYAFPRLEIKVTCGKGTYIRSLARDLGDRLGCGGLVATLRRERVGPFLAEIAVHLHTDRETGLASLQPAAAALALLPRVALHDEKVVQLRHGQAVTVDEVLPAGTECSVFDVTGRLVGVARVDGSQLRPAKIIMADYDKAL